MARRNRRQLPQKRAVSGPTKANHAGVIRSVIWRIFDPRSATRTRFGEIKREILGKIGRAKKRLTGSSRYSGSSHVEIWFARCCKAFIRVKGARARRIPMVFSALSRTGRLPMLRA